VLEAPSRDLLTGWLVGCKTGDSRLRGGLPSDLAGWKVGDKTGSGDHNTTNDVAILWPPNRPPILVTAYLTGSKLDSDGRNAILAEMGAAVAAEIAAV
jgi:beta-lactamase class A